MEAKLDMDAVAHVFNTINSYLTVNERDIIIPDHF